MSVAEFAKINKTTTDQLIKLGLVVGGNLYPDIPTTEVATKILRNARILQSFEATLKITGFPNVDLKSSMQLLHGLFTHVLPHDNRIFMKYIVMSLMTGITLVLVLLRLYSRQKLTKRLWPEDWWALAGFCGTVAVYITHMMAINYGAAERHIYDVPFNRILTITSLTYNVALATIKMTFIVFYYRLIPDRTYRRALLAVVAFIMGTLIAGIICVLLQCDRVDYWNDYFKTKCLDKVLANTILGVFTIISDFLLLLLPIWKISSLKIRSRKEKIMIVGMFAAGGLVCIANVYRIIAFNDLLKATDATYATVAMSFWGLLELDLAIVISCLPALKHLFVGSKAAKSMASLSNKITHSSSSSRKRKAEQGSQDLMQTEVGDGVRIESDRNDVDVEAGMPLTTTAALSMEEQRLLEMQSRGSESGALLEQKPL